VSDYRFRETGGDGTDTTASLSELFADGHDTLAVYSFMFPREAGDERPGPESGTTALLALEDGPCPSCVALLDQFDGMARHSSDRFSLVVVAKAAPERLRAYAAERGWRHLRLLSGADSPFSRDYGGEASDGGQRPMLNVFRRDEDAIYHFWGSELLYSPAEPGQEYRHVGTIEPLWNFFDLTPAGRPDSWDEQLSYHCH
jgi:predicted dithiol-disulfide oxidoreductase (DUF899 family)